MLDKEKFLQEVNPENRLPLVKISSYGFESGLEVDFLTSTSEEEFFIERGAVNIVRESRYLIKKISKLLNKEFEKFFEDVEEKLDWRVDKNLRGWIKINEDVSYDLVENVVRDFENKFGIKLEIR